MSKTVIKIENLSKIYRLGEVGTGTISHDLNRWWKMNVLGQDDPYAKIGHVNDRTAKAEKGEMVAALRDINLEVKEGEVLGIIGKNGAGKSTLLKILSRVTSPTTGSVKVSGRMASLLEVGTGFHPDMTGRENIYMNGTIMGMRKWEITKKLDEIVEFAGVAKYLDTPVKRYSSGMTVRLGFAIAAHLEPEILIVDEVLAVGDAEFQKKAIGKMQDVSRNDGRTVLFVSHNMAAIQNLCSNAVIMENGLVSAKENTNTAIANYLNRNKEKVNEYKAIKTGNTPYIKRAYITQGNEIADTFQIDKEITINIEVEDLQHLNISTTVLIENQDGIIIYHTTDEFADIELTKSKKCKIPPYGLAQGKYAITIALAQRNIQIFEKLQDVLIMQVVFAGKTAELNTENSWKGLTGPGVLKWS